MTGTDSTDLSGTSVLIVEDEFYLAMDMKDAIERAGGHRARPLR